MKTVVKSGVQTVDINRLRQEDKKKKKIEKSFDEQIEDYTLDEELRKALKNHLPIRKRRGSLTDNSLKLGFDNLDILTKNIKDEQVRNEEKIKIVNQSISNGWGGFFEVKKTKPKEQITHREELPTNLDELFDN